jgi:hypothetical protein
MKEKDFIDILIGLTKEIVGVSNAPNKYDVTNGKQSTVQDWSGYLRTLIKYQQFEIEAQKRENEYLRKLLNDKND